MKIPFYPVVFNLIFTFQNGVSLSHKQNRKKENQWHRRAWTFSDDTISKDNKHNFTPVQKKNPLVGLNRPYRKENTLHHQRDHFQSLPGVFLQTGNEL